MAQLLEQPPQTALAIYAHPDDADVSCGGTLARWVREGCEVHVLLCTTGDKGTDDPRADPAEIVRIRAAEVAESAALVGVASHHVLDHPDGELEDDRSFRAEIVAWIRKLRPETVLCPDPTAVLFGEDYFNHRDHRVVGLTVLDALSPASAMPLYFPEAGPAHQANTVLLSGTLEPTVWVDVTTTISAKVAAVSCHRSQFAGDGDWAAQAVRLRAQEDGRRAGVAYAEGYRRLRLGG
jgi:LmbE family N-acetylglucosaminyl deacetylase